MPKYEGNEELYTKLGVSRTAYDLFDTWNSGDTDVFSTEVMKELAASREKKKPGLSTAADFLKEVPERFMEIREKMMEICKDKGQSGGQSRTK